MNEDGNDEIDGATTGPNGPRRGRPPGSVALSRNREQAILSFIRAGTFDHVAAEAVGVSARALREWVARGEGTHPTRPCTPKLRRFAERYRTAKAEARAGQEVRVYREDPRFWLTHVARSTPERDGWTAQPKEQDTGGPLERWIAEFEADVAEMGRAGEDGTPRCSDSECPCVYHERRAEDVERAQRSKG